MATTQSSSHVARELFNSLLGAMAQQVHRLGHPSAQRVPELRFAPLLHVVWPAFQTADNRWVGSEVLLHGTQTTVLDRGAPLDDESDRGGPTLGRLLKGVSHEPARCLTRHSAVRDIPDNCNPPGQV